jgi:hypothetical protein
LSAGRPPASDLELTIAGVTFAISSGRSFPLRCRDENYRPFVGQAVKSATRSIIRTFLRFGEFPSLGGMEKVYDTGESWSMYREKKDLWITLAPPGKGLPFWTARFDSRASRLTFFCRSLPALPGSKKKDLDLPIVYPIDQLLLMYYFARRRGLLLHGAGMVLKNRAYVFAGVSGAGKSTFSELLVKARAGKVLSDERMIVRALASEMVAFGTPWSGTACIARDGSAPLAGIFFLKHGSANAIRPLMPVEALDRLLPAVSIPWYDPDTAAPIIAFAKQLTTAIPCHEFSFTPDSEAIDCFQEFLKQESLQRKKLKGKRKK